MGRTLLGIDLDESPVGSLVERLLAEEDLEKLADGGRPSEDSADRAPDDDADGEGSSIDGRGDDTADGTVGEDDDGDGGRLAGLRPLLLKAAIALAVLAVLAVVAYRYMGRVKETVPDSVGMPSPLSDDGGETHEPESDGVGGAGVSPARRRAKGRDGTDAVGRGAVGSDDSSGDSPDDGEGAPRADPSLAEDVDLGALVGLAALALVAAAVRKFGEDRPRDPLVDGPDE
ncbi:MAG: hypothetical protein ABEJ40_08100 [Haloarculaceae archaeon]